MNRILVTGSTGTIDSRLVRTLLDDGQTPSVLVRDPRRLAALDAHAHRVLPLTGDYGDPASLDSALRGVDRVFLISPNSPDQVGHESAVVDAAVRAGVSRIVKVSAQGADPDSAVAFWRWHAAIETHLTASGVPYIALRPTFSMANILGHTDGVRDHGIVFAPAIETPISMIDPQDVADAAAHLLTSERLPAGGPVIELSGPAGVTFDDLAAMLSRQLGRTVRYQPGTVEEVTDHLAGRGTPCFVIEQILAIFTALRAGQQATPVPTVAELLGRQPHGFDAFLSTHLEAFRAAS